MTYINWEIKAKEFGNCNCDYGCPCQFNALPTDGTCKAVVGIEIEEGHFGDVNLDSLVAVSVYKWPGAVHQGEGIMQVIIDNRATEEQRDALIKILHGEETEPGKTVWNVYTSTMSTILDPIFSNIEFKVDIEKREARMVVLDILDSIGEPIKNPVTGNEHRARIDLTDGFEYTIAEMGSGTSSVTGKIPMELEKSYGQFANIHLSTNGIVR